MVTYFGGDGRLFPQKLEILPSPTFILQNQFPFFGKTTVRKMKKAENKMPEMLKIDRKGIHIYCIVEARKK